MDHVPMEATWIQGSLGFWTLRRGFRIPDTGFWILC